MKFKVGDKIRVKKECRDLIMKHSMFMKEIINKYDVFTVAEECLLHESFFRIEEDNKDWIWVDMWFEKVEELPKPVFDDIKLSYCGRTTIAMHNGKFGESIRGKDDKEDRKVGILIATMRALGFKKNIVDKVVDVLFDDLKEIDKCTTEELLKEISIRIKK